MNTYGPAGAELPHSGAAETVSDAAFGKDLVHLMPLLNRFSFSLCRDRDFATDLAQETLYNAWKARASFRPGSNLKAWLFTILRNLFYSHRRHAWRQSSQDEARILDMPGPDNVQDWAVQASDAVRAMRGLSFEQRQALILIGVAGFSYADAATICGCCNGTLKSRVARARRTVLAALDNLQPPSLPRPPVGRAGQEIMRELQDAMPSRVKRLPVAA